MFALATWLARHEMGYRPWIFRACLAGLGLLLVQSVFGGLTVLYGLPDAVSTTHLGLAFAFLALATALAASTSEEGRPLPGLDEGSGRRLRSIAAVSAGLVFVQSVLGGLVRHTDGGMACPDIPLCLGQVVPPLVNVQITSHFFHRVLALVVTGAVLWMSVVALRADVPRRLRAWILAAAALVVTQVALGVVSVLTVLAVAPVALHTLLAAALLSVLVGVATLSGRFERSRAGRPAPGATSGAEAAV